VEGDDHQPLTGPHAGDDELQRELRKEAATMALYVAICLLAALTVSAEHADRETTDVFALVWGTTVGLALAHWFAFRLSARLVSKGSVSRHDAAIAGAQVGGAAIIALLATVGIVLFPDSAELDVTRVVVAVFVAAVAYLVGREAGASRGRSLLYGGVVLVAALAVAIVKNVLAGH
jgi:hypothetical protein